MLSFVSKSPFQQARSRKCTRGCNRSTVHLTAIELSTAAGHQDQDLLEKDRNSGLLDLKSDGIVQDSIHVCNSEDFSRASTWKICPK